MEIIKQFNKQVLATYCECKQQMAYYTGLLKMYLFLGELNTCLLIYSRLKFSSLET